MRPGFFGPGSVSGAASHAAPSLPARFVLMLRLFALFGAIGWGFYTLTLRHQAGVDWMVFYTASHAYLDGHLGVLFDGERFTALLNSRFAGWLAFPMSFLPWVNPPNFLLMILPFGLLPFALSYALFEGVTLLLLIAALAFCIRDRARLPLLIFALVACPATPFTIFLGQSSFLSGALLIAGFTLTERRPTLAGILFGILAYKPQFCLLIPVALIAGRHWRVLLAAAATAALAVLVSAAIFGLGPWRDWLDFALGASELYRHWSATARLTGQSVYSCLVILGASPALANLAQGAALLGAGAATYWCYRKSLPDHLRLAVLLAASLLAAPHVSTSDGLLAGLAAILYLDARLDRALRLDDVVLASLLWVSPLMSPPHLFVVGTAIPLLLCVFIVSAMRRDGGKGLPAPGVVAG